MFVHYQIKNDELVRIYSLNDDLFFSLIGPTKPTDGYLQECDLDQIDKCM